MLYLLVTAHWIPFDRFHNQFLGVMLHPWFSGHVKRKKRMSQLPHGCSLEPLPLAATLVFTKGVQFLFLGLQNPAFCWRVKKKDQKCRRGQGKSTKWNFCKHTDYGFSPRPTAKWSVACLQGSRGGSWCPAAQQNTMP